MRAAIVFALSIPLFGLVACDQVYGLRRPTVDASSDATSSDSDIGAGLVARFPLDTAIGIADIDGRFVGVCRGTCPVDTPGKVGGAVRFDGTNAVELTSRPELETNAAFTITGWYYLSPQFAAVGCPFGKVYQSSGNSWQLCINVNRVVHFFSPNNLLVGGTIDLNRWYHIAMRWDGAVKTILVDGIERMAVPQVTVFDTGVLSIGGDFDDGNLVTPFSGSIDELRIYNRALSTDEIVEMVNSAQ